MFSTGLAEIVLIVQDVERSARFYRDVVGLDFIASFEPPGLAFLQLGDTRLLLEGGAPPTLLYLGVDDVEQATQELRAAGVAIDTEPHVIFEDVDGRFGPPGENEEMAFFRDSEGNRLILSEPPAA